MNCKEQVVDGWTIRKCARAAVSDGYCKQHHPDAVKKRLEESDRRYQEQLEKSPLVRLGKANERIAELEEENKRLRADAARLDWLADPANVTGTVQLPHRCVMANLDSLRGAIDMAMGVNESQRPEAIKQRWEEWYAKEGEKC